MLPRFVVTSILLLFCPGAPLPAQTTATAESFQKALTAAEKATRPATDRIAAQRSAIVNQFRSAKPGPWQQKWDETKIDRKHIQEAFLTLARRLKTFRKAALKTRLDLANRLLTSWIARGETADIRQSWSLLPAQESALLSHMVDTTRRKLLDAVIKRTRQTPGCTDLDVLIESVAWEALFLTTALGNPIRADELSTDLILLFTDRGADGISLSRAGFYQSGLLLDLGFRSEFRDESNQVRHFAWALRMFVKSEDHKSTASVLRLKEWRDSRTRKIPINEADLKLNEAANRVATVLKLREDPLRIADVPALLRRTLGPAKAREVKNR